MTLVLTEEKRQLLATTGHVLVRGGAGSGKTTIALVKAGMDLDEGRLGAAGSALFLSFARATVARVAEQATATIASNQLQRIEINTYHGFAWTILKSHGYLLCARPSVRLLLPTEARDRLAGLEGEARLTRQQQLFDEDGLVSFDFFPTLLVELFTRLPVLADAYARAYPLIIVDEFQDTNAAEWAMISTLGQRSRLIALGDPKQRIYDFKGADPRRFDEFIATFQPAPFDFGGENNRSAGTDIARFADAILDGNYRLEPYAGVNVIRYNGQGLYALKRTMLEAVKRCRRLPEWSVAILVPTNALAIEIFGYLGRSDHGLPIYPAEILVAAEGPILASNLIALLLEPNHDAHQLGALALEALASFELGRNEIASKGSLKAAAQLRKVATQVRQRKDAGYGNRGIPPFVRDLLAQVRQIVLTGDPVSDWLQVRAALDASPREELQQVAREARYLQLLQRGAQIEGRFAEAWRIHGAYHAARELFAAAVVEDQFSATTRLHRGVTVMTIHKSKGKEFDEVIVFEGMHKRFLRVMGGDRERSARFNLHVAATRAKRGVVLMTPRQDPCPLLP